MKKETQSRDAAHKNIQPSRKPQTHTHTHTHTNDFTFDRHITNLKIEYRLGKLCIMTKQLGGPTCRICEQ